MMNIIHIHLYDEKDHYINVCMKGCCSQSDKLDKYFLIKYHYSYLVPIGDLMNIWTLPLLVVFIVITACTCSR